MPTISENSNLFTEIVVFTVESEQQQELVDAIVSEVERWVRHRSRYGCIFRTWLTDKTPTSLIATLSLRSELKFHSSEPQVH